MLKYAPLHAWKCPNVSPCVRATSPRLQNIRRWVRAELGFTFEPCHVSGCFEHAKTHSNRMVVVVFSQSIVRKSRSDLPSPLVPHVPSRANALIGRPRARPLPDDPPRPRSQMTGLNGLCTGLCDMCTDSESSPRNDLPKSDKHVRMAQALRDATSSSRPLCGRPERATTDLNSQVLARCAVGMVWALPDGLSGHAQAGFET